MTNLWEAAEDREKEETAGQLEVRVDQQIGLLNWNFEELNRQLDIQLAKYDGLTFTESEMTQAKKVRANLNKVAKVINDRKIEVKKQFCEPYDRFADQAKVLVGKIQTVSGKIDQQVKDFEQKQKAEKKEQIRSYWEQIGIPQIDLGQIWDEKWLNASVRIDQVKKEIDRIKDGIQNDLAAIAQMSPPEKVDWCLTSYLRTLDIGQTLSAWEEYQRQIKRVEEIRAQQEAEKAAREAKAAEVEEIPASATDDAKTAQNEPQAPKTATRWVYTIEFKGSAEEMRRLGEQLRSLEWLNWKVINRKKEER